MKQSTLNDLLSSRLARTPASQAFNYFLGDETIPEEMKKFYEDAAKAGRNHEEILDAIVKTANSTPDKIISDVPAKEIGLETDVIRQQTNIGLAAKTALNLGADVLPMFTPSAAFSKMPVLGRALTKIPAAVRPGVEYALQHGPLSKMLGMLGARPDQELGEIAADEALNVALMGGSSLAGKAAQGLISTNVTPSVGQAFKHALIRGGAEGGFNWAAARALGADDWGQFLALLGGGSAGGLAGLAAAGKIGLEQLNAKVKEKLDLFGIKAPAVLFRSDSAIHEFIKDPGSHPGLVQAFKAAITELSGKSRQVMGSGGSTESAQNAMAIERARNDIRRAIRDLSEAPDKQAQSVVDFAEGAPGAFAKEFQTRIDAAETAARVAQETAAKQKGLAELSFEQKQQIATEQATQAKQQAKLDVESAKIQTEARARQAAEKLNQQTQEAFQRNISQELPGKLAPEFQGVAPEQILDTYTPEKAGKIVEDSISRGTKAEKSKADTAFTMMRFLFQQRGGRAIPADPAFLQQALETQASRMAESPVINPNGSMTIFLNKILALAGDDQQPLPFDNLYSAVIYYKAFNNAERRLVKMKDMNAASIVGSMRNQLRDYIAGRAKAANRPDLADAFLNANAIWQAMAEGTKAAKKQVPGAFTSEDLVTSSKTGQMMTRDTADVAGTIDRFLGNNFGDIIRGAGKGMNIRKLLYDFMLGKIKPDAIKNLIREMPSIKFKDKQRAIEAVNQWSTPDRAQVAQIEQERQAIPAAARAAAIGDIGTANQQKQAALDLAEQQKMFRLQQIEQNKQQDVSQAEAQKNLWKTSLTLKPIHGDISETDANLVTIGKAREMHSQASPEAKKSIEAQVLSEIVKQSKDANTRFFDRSTFNRNLKKLGIDFIDTRLMKALGAIEEPDMQKLGKLKSLKKTMAKGSSAKILNDFISNPDNVNAENLQTLWQHMLDTNVSRKEIGAQKRALTQYLADGIFSKNGKGAINPHAPGVWDAMPKRLKNQIFSPAQQELMGNYMDLASSLYSGARHIENALPTPVLSHTRQVFSMSAFGQAALGIPRTLGLILTVKLPQKIVETLMSGDFSGIEKSGQMIRNLTTVVKNMLDWAAPENENASREN